MRDLTERLRENRMLGRHMFDRAESLVIESLRRQYWKEFETSPEYKKLLNFLWFQDRTVAPDDFFVMRVLGRGGFGLVHGKRLQQVATAVLLMGSLLTHLCL